MLSYFLAVSVKTMKPVGQSTIMILEKVELFDITTWDKDMGYISIQSMKNQSV